MNRRMLSIVVVLVLANYIVFSALAVLAFPTKPITPPLHTAQPTFTPGGQPLQRVDPLTYDFLTPSPTAVLTTTVTPTRRP